MIFSKHAGGNRPGGGEIDVVRGEVVDRAVVQHGRSSACRGLHARVIVDIQVGDAVVSMEMGAGLVRSESFRP